MSGERECATGQPMTPAKQKGRVLIGLNGWISLGLLRPIAFDFMMYDYIHQINVDN